MSVRRARAGDQGRLPPSPDLALVRRADRTHAVRGVALFALLVAVSLLTRWPFLHHPFLNVDEAAHLVGARELLRGGRLYVDFADNKPPLIHVFYAVARLLLGEGIFAVRLLAALVLLPLTALGASAFHGHGRRGRAAALAFLVASTALLASDAHAIHCEHVLLLPLAWSMALLRSPVRARRAGHLFAAGALLGTATLTKQPAAACLVVPLFLIFRPGRAAPPRARYPLPEQTISADPASSDVLLRLGALLGGFAAPLLTASVFFMAQGTLEEAVFWIWRYNLGHIDNPMPLADAARSAITRGALVLPSAGALLAGALLPWLRRGHRRAIPALLAIATFLPALLGMRLFGHYFLPLLFALSLAAAPFLGARGHVPFRAPVVAFGLFAAAAFTVAGRVVHDPARPIADATRIEYEQIGDALRRDSACAGDRLFVWGYAPSIYAYADARPASRFVVPIDTLTGYLAGNDAAIHGRVDTSARIVPAHWDLLMADLTARPPAHIVDTAPGDLNEWGRFPLHRFPRLLALVQRDYHVFAVAGGAVIYRNNSCSPRPRVDPR